MFFSSSFPKHPSDATPIDVSAEILLLVHKSPSTFNVRTRPTSFNDFRATVAFVSVKGCTNKLPIKTTTFNPMTKADMLEKKQRLALQLLLLLITSAILILLLHFSFFRGRKFY